MNITVGNIKYLNGLFDLIPLPRVFIVLLISDHLTDTTQAALLLPEVNNMGLLNSKRVFSEHLPTSNSNVDIILQVEIILKVQFGILRI